MKLVEFSDRARWDGFVGAHPAGHPLQLWGWGEVKRANRWKPVRLALVEGEMIMAAAQVLFWDVPKLGRAIAYVPRGPVVEAGSKLADELLAEMALYAQKHKAMYLRIEPGWVGDAPSKPWRRSRQGILMNETYSFDLTKPMDDILAGMSRKTRQYIRKSEADGVAVLTVDEARDRYPEQYFDPMEAFWRIYSETATRAGFGTHELEYYRRLYDELGEHNTLLFGFINGQAEAFLWDAQAGGTSFELYGGVTERGSEARANYTLKYQAIMLAKDKLGCKLYDFNGRLEGGVARFKASFGPEEINFVGTYDLPFNYALYVAWERLWPVAKPIGRKLMRSVKS